MIITCSTRIFTKTKQNKQKNYCAQVVDQELSLMIIGCNNADIIIVVYNLHFFSGIRMDNDILILRVYGHHHHQLKRPVYSFILMIIFGFFINISTTQHNTQRDNQLNSRSLFMNRFFFKFLVQCNTMY